MSGDKSEVLFLLELLLALDLLSDPGLESSRFVIDLDLDISVDAFESSFSSFLYFDNFSKLAYFESSLFVNFDK